MVATLGAVTKPRVGQNGPTSGAQFTYVDISSVDNRAKRIVEPKQLPADASPSRARQNLLGGDVITSMTRPNLNAVALLPADLNGAVGSTGFHVLRANKAAEPRFLFYVVQGEAFVQQMTEKVQGALYPAIRPADIRSFQFPLPPVAEQRRIVTVLDAAFRRLDAAAERLARVRKLVKQFRAALLSAAVEGRLTEGWRAEHGADVEPASALLERILAERRARWEAEQREKYARTGKTPSFNWQAKYEEPVAPDPKHLPELPEGWCWATIQQLIQVGPQNGLYKPSSAYGEGTQILRIDDYDNSGLRAGQVLRRLYVTPEESQTYCLQPDDIVINRVNSLPFLGKVLVVSSKLAGSVYESNMMRIHLTEHVQVHCISLTLRSPEGRKRLTSNAKLAVNQASINQTDVVTTVIPIPPLTEQQEIVRRVEEQMRLADAVKARVAQAGGRVERLRQALLAKAFRGELVPHDAGDETGDALVE
jgi:type I restriction enzyme, S subunit